MCEIDEMEGEHRKAKFVAGKGETDKEEKEKDCGRLHTKAMATQAAKCVPPFIFLMRSG